MRILGRRIVTTAFICALMLTSLPTPAFAVAAATPDEHADHDHEAGSDHAAQDLIGSNISDIERSTKANAERIEKETGRKPGLAPHLQDQPQVSALAVADPGVSGSWSPVLTTPIVPIFQAVLPNGKILMWDSVGDNAAENYQNHTFTRAMVWNPATNTFKRVDVQGYNIFCAGFAHLPNGNILVAGGNKNAALNGIVQTHVFNWQTETWTRGNDMASERWYPSVTRMANGEATIVGGGPAVPEVYQNNGTLRSLSGFSYTAGGGGRLYPFMLSRPDTQLGIIGPGTTAFTLNTSGNGVITGTATRDTINRNYGSFATYDIGKSLVVGGGVITEDGVANVPTKTSVIVNSNTGLAATTTASGSMAKGRRQHNATVLADGSVLATGGLSSGAGLVDLNNAVTAAERWNPATGIWTTLASASRVRQYHSTANLLPDGRVLTGGGGICGRCVELGYLEKNIEYFTPPYLYKQDGSGQLAARPVIATAPASIAINTNFTITSSQAANIRKVGLVGLGDATHGVDQGQSYIPLTYTVSGTTLTVTGPATGGIATPGYYMLFITDAAGVPSVAKTIQVAKSPNPVMSPVKNSSSLRCIDVPNASLTIRTYLQAHSCNNSKAQMLTRLPSDNSLRVLGNCIDVPNKNFVSGQRIFTYSCNGTSAQTWSVRTDGTIRPIANAALCLAAASNVENAAVLLATCNGSTLQKWTL